MLVWGQWQTDAWLAVEFGFVLGDPTADGGFAQVQFVTELGDAVCPGQVFSNTPIGSQPLKPAQTQV